jgi:hypothetical protein
MIDVTNVPTAVKDKIIKDYMIKSYHWTIGIGMFMIGFLLGVIVSG